MRLTVKSYSGRRKFLNLIWVTDQENSMISSINHLRRVCTVLISVSVLLGRLTEEAIILEGTGLCRESSSIDFVRDIITIISPHTKPANTASKWLRFLSQTQEREKPSLITTLH